MHKVLTNRWTQVVVFVLCLGPVVSLGWRALTGGLTANPIEFITHATGDWTLRFICITLAITPLRKILGLPDLIRFRRMLGLFAFFYGCLHFATYVVLDKFFDFPEMWKDVAKRPYITLGFLAFVLMIPLAVTSTAGWIRRLGGRRWQWLHRAIYITAVAGVIHYYWSVKSAVIRPLTYAAIVALLLLWRLAARFWPRTHTVQEASAKPQPQKAQA
ncbi:MAG TPA: protein-methionine-sulfoxide reductase heme-binding subunit MsrQ [Candidatus Eisenbacteria bacterium]|nr:protein-methionine-sulfoxide reductase heme-binding subunit MsrQ [Candidatus Eisenbacteria bacterium]